MKGLSVQVNVLANDFLCCSARLHHALLFSAFYDGQCKFIYDWKYLSKSSFFHNFGTFQKFSEKIQGEVTRIVIDDPAPFNFRPLDKTTLKHPLRSNRQTLSRVTVWLHRNHASYLDANRHQVPNQNLTPRFSTVHL